MPAGRTVCTAFPPRGWDAGSRRFVRLRGAEAARWVVGVTSKSGALVGAGERDAARRRRLDRGDELVGRSVGRQLDLLVEQVQRELVGVRSTTWWWARAAPAGVAEGVDRLGRSVDERLATADRSGLCRQPDDEPVHEAVGIGVEDGQRQLGGALRRRRPRDQRDVAGAVARVLDGDGRAVVPRSDELESPPRCRRTPCSSGCAAGPVDVVVEPVEAVVVVELVVDVVDEVVDDVAGMNSVGGGATVVEVDVVVFCSWNLA